MSFYVWWFDGFRLLLRIDILYTGAVCRSLSFHTEGLTMEHCRRKGSKLDILLLMVLLCSSITVG